MKLRQLISVVAIIVAVASCTPKQTLSEQLTGTWRGTNNIELTMIDSVGNTVIQEFSAPIEIEYLADSTFTSIITINEGNIIKMGGIATFLDTTAVVTGSLSYMSIMDISGQMSINANQTLNFKYTAESPAEGLVHRGVVTATRVQE